MQHHDPDPNKGLQRKEPGISEMDGAFSREGGDDALAYANPTDPRADEKVIVNEQESNRTVNRTAQTELGHDADDIVND